MNIVYGEKEVFRTTLKYFKNDELATNVWVTKYALRNAEGELLEKSPIDMFNRLTDELFRIEQQYPNPMDRASIHRLLVDFKNLIPAGSILYGLGNNHSYSSLGNCFTIGNDSDSYGGILSIDQEQVQLMKRRAGVGHDLSHYRSRGSYVSNAAKSSSGIVSFMERFSNSTREVAQDGRRGALMLTLDVDHPDVEDFITSKDDTTKLTGANISVKITDEFMHKVQNNDPKAVKIWKKIIHQAHKSAEPGVLFWDNIIKESPADCYADDGFKTTSTNPCSELPLSPYDSCRLLSINLTTFVRSPFEKGAEFDFAKLSTIVCPAQRLMDNIIDLEAEKITRILAKIESDPEPEKIKVIERDLWTKVLQSLLHGRRTGLSGIGLADVFAELNIAYDSKEAILLAEKIYQTIAKASYKTSILLARERGAFPAWSLDKERNNPFIRRVMSLMSPETVQDYMKTGRRNIANLTIPPSGSLAILAKISSGIEPIFNIHYKRRRKVEKGNIVFVDKSGDKWEEYKVFHPKFLEWYATVADGISAADDAKNALQRADSKLLERIIMMSPYYKSTANEIDFYKKVKMQGAIQKWVDHSISITTNLPEETTEEVVEDLYYKAWLNKCKGFTIYREGSRDGVLINNDSTTTEFVQHDAPKRPRVLPGEAFSTTVKGEKFTVVIGLLTGKPYEIFAYKGNGISGKGTITKQKRGAYIFSSADVSENISDDLTDEQEIITRAFSYGLRHGGDVMFAVEQLNKAKGDLSSFGKAIARILKKFIENGKSARASCEQCGNELKYEDGCVSCTCGWTKC